MYTCYLISSWCSTLRLSKIWASLVSLPRILSHLIECDVNSDRMIVVLGISWFSHQRQMSNCVHFQWGIMRVEMNIPIEKGYIHLLHLITNVMQIHRSTELLGTIVVAIKNTNGMSLILRYGKNLYKVCRLHPDPASFFHSHHLSTPRRITHAPLVSVASWYILFSHPFSYTLSISHNACQKHPHFLGSCPHRFGVSPCRPPGRLIWQ